MIPFRYKISWVQHFLFYFLATIFGLALFYFCGWPVALALSAAIGAAFSQECTQYDVFRGRIPWCDYVADLISDGIGIGLAYIIVSLFI